MQAYRCRVCDAPLFFENSVCVSCGSPLGYAREERAIVPVAAGRYIDADGLIWHVCRNLNLSGCTWLARLEGGQCEACDLTRVRPADHDLNGLANFVPAERAKRHLVVELDRLGLEVRSRAADPEGLAFDLLSSALQPVVTGHVDGVITIDLAESDAAHREGLREQLAEPYRTLLGHFRHEIGHYFQWRLVRTDAAAIRFRELFGDEREDYQGALDRHYAEGAPAGWPERFISAYATMHPSEDFAETWAHMMHILDSVDSAVAYGLVDEARVAGADGMRALVVDVWIPLSTGLNIVNRSMGKDDLYPFAIPAPVLDKLEFAGSLLPR